MRVSIFAIAIIASLSSSVCAQRESVLHSFAGTDGDFPRGRLLLDNEGRLYGTTVAGGVYNNGVAFLLSPSHGAWSEETLHNFGAGSDAASPWAGLTEGSDGALYGATVLGGKRNKGAVFKLDRRGDAWTEQIIRTLRGKKNAQHAYCDLVVTSSGHIYGTAFAGGEFGWGAVFELTQSRNSWKRSIIHGFDYNNDGASPVAGLVESAQGVLYGATQRGGAFGGGTAYELAPAGSGWKFTVLHAFGDSQDADAPYASLVLDESTGALYGTTYWGGASYEGTVFKLAPSRDGWKENVLHSFGGGADGAYPYAALHRARTGVLYGTTTLGGANSAGTVFEVTHANGAWSERVLHSFGASGDGAYPYGGLVEQDGGTTLYGATAGGGSAGGSGTVFEIVP